MYVLSKMCINNKKINNNNNYVISNYNNNNKNINNKLTIKIIHQQSIISYIHKNCVQYSIRDATTHEVVKAYKVIRVVN